MCSRVRAALEALQKKAHPADEIHLWKAAYINLSREVPLKEAAWQRLCEEHVIAFEAQVAGLRRQLGEQPYLKLFQQLGPFRFRLELLGGLQRTLALFVVLPLLVAEVIMSFGLIVLFALTAWLAVWSATVAVLGACCIAAAHIAPAFAATFAEQTLDEAGKIEPRLIVAALSGALAFGAFKWGKDAFVAVAGRAATFAHFSAEILFRRADEEGKPSPPPPASIVVRGAGTPAANGVYTHTPGETFGGCPLFKKGALWLLRYRMPNTGNTFWYIADKNNLHNDAGDLYRCRSTDPLPPVDGWSLAIDGAAPPPMLELVYV